jgi:predicted CoA-binding protein
MHAMPYVDPSEDTLRALLSGGPVIAIVGASSDPARPAHGIMKLLLDRGFRVIPVNPNETVVLGRQAYPSLETVPEPVDIVDVFRRAEATPPIADSAVRIGARVLWLQLGIRNEEAARRAEEGGLTVVMDRCLGETVQELGIRA